MPQFPKKVKRKLAAQIPCPECGGTGNDGKCKPCRGTGTVWKGK